MGVRIPFLIWGIFIFLAAAEKPTLVGGGGYNFRNK